MRRLEHHQAVGRGHIQCSTGRLQFQKALHSVPDGQPGDGHARFVHENDVVLVFAPVDSDVYSHADLLAHALEAKDVPGGRVPVRALIARHAFDGAAWQAWGTVPMWRSKRTMPVVLNARLVPMG